MVIAVVTVCALCAVCAPWCGALAKGLSKMKTLERLRARGSVETRAVPTHNRGGGRKVLFWIAEESAAKPAQSAA